MKYIIPLIKISRHAFGINPAKWGSKLRQFYYAVETGKVNNREEAADYLYQKKPQSTTYKSMEESARDKMIEEILVHDLTKCNDYQRKVILTRKVNTVVNILILLGLKSIAIQLAEWIIKYAKNYHVTEIELSLSDILERYYLSVGLDPKKAAKYEKLSDKALFAYQVEREARRSYARFFSQFDKTKNITSESISQINEICDSLKDYYGMIQSFTYLQHYYRLLTIKHELDYDYESLLKTADEAYNFFDNLHFEHKATKLVFLNAKMSALIAMRRYHDTLKIIEFSERLKPEKGFNWSRNRQLAFLTSINLKKPEEAKKYIEEVTNQKRYKFYQKELHVTFDLFSIYLDLFCGKIIDESTLRTFQTYIKDPTGMGISVRVAQLWNAGIQDDQFIGDLRPSTQKFIQRNLDHRHKRSRLMLELILQIPKLMYKKQDFIKITGLLYEEMCAIEPHFCPEANEIEILTYELLWHQILKTVVPNKYESLKPHYAMEYIKRNL